jgi:hypothetical protein
MFVEFKCRCGHEFRTRSQNAGLPIICPNCTNHLIVPGLDSNSDLDQINDESPATSDSERPAWPITGNPAAPSKPVPATRPSTRKVEPDAAIEPVSRAETKENPSRRSPDDSDERFDLSGIGSIEAEDDVEDVDDYVFDDVSLPQLKRKKIKKNVEIEKGVAPQKGKKEKNGKPTRDRSANLPLIIGGTVVGFLVMASIGFFAVPPLIGALKEGRKVKLPREFEKFSNDETMFRCEIPKGWEAEARGGSGNIPPSVKIEKGTVKITYRSSLSGAAIQDMAQAGTNLAEGELPDVMKPVARVHEFQREKTLIETPDYKEIGPVEKIDTGWGEGRLSTFTGSVGFGGKYYGYRVTLLTTQYQWNVTCKCANKREFEAYAPIFRRIIESTGR